ncbi:MAG: diguanylate cyclase, partial [Woeseiaceae bacterium]|nr:diguanylate cyclase [Woeseiaceae bacterium]
MKDPLSRLDAWRNIGNAEPQKSPVESHLPLILSAAGAFGILPFMVLRYMHGEWAAAVIDTIIVVGLFALGVYVYKSRRVVFTSIAIACFCVGGIIATVYIIGPNQIYWAYPALMAIFYVVRPQIAIVLVAATLAAIIPRLIEHFDTHSMITIVVTIVVMSSFAFGFSLTSNRQRERLVKLATKDPLTGAGNRRHLDNKLRDVVNAHRRSGTKASMLMFDLDHFKRVNDVHGHAVGDQILIRITEIVNLRIRVTDSLYRIGGEEFVVVLEGQDIANAAHLAEQLRMLVQTNELVSDQPVTISLGVAELRS